MYGYLSKFKAGSIRIRTEKPDYSNLPENELDWTYNVYGDVKEEIPTDIPEPLGKDVIISSYVDANLYHDFVTGRSVTGILTFLNKTPIDWYSKRQSTVETSTYGSEFVAARIGVEQLIDLRTTLRYLGVPIISKSYMFGDNNSVIMNSTIPTSNLKKRHNALSYHKVREAICGKYIAYYKIPSENNYGDLMSKHNGYQQAYPLLRELLFWKGKADIDAIRTMGECQGKPKSD